jgi:hypothetical protein
LISVFGANKERTCKPRESEHGMAPLKKASGQSLTEYALPVACILLVGGVIAMTVDINGIIDDYFMAASGHSAASKTGTTFKPGQLGAEASGATGNGAAGFDSMGRLIDGAGGSISVGGGSFTYDGPTSRSSRPQVAGSNGDFIYDVKGRGPMFELAAKLAREGAPAEYVGRILNSAALTEQLAQSKANGTSTTMNAYTAALRSQLASNQAYAMSHMNEVLAHGGLEGVSIWKTAMGSSISNSDQITKATNELADVASVSRLERYRQLLEQGAENDKLNAANERCALHGAVCAMTGTEADAETLASLLQEAGTSSPGEQLLMNKDNTSAYVYQNYTQLTGPKAEQEYKSGMPEEE